MDTRPLLVFGICHSLTRESHNSAAYSWKIHGAVYANSPFFSAGEQVAKDSKRPSQYTSVAVGWTHLSHSVYQAPVTSQRLGQNYLERLFFIFFISIFMLLAFPKWIWQKLYIWKEAHPAENIFIVLGGIFSRKVEQDGRKVALKFTDVVPEVKALLGYV